MVAAAYVSRTRNVAELFRDLGIPMARKKDKETHIRKFIDNAANADSYIHLTVFSYGNATLKVADCTRSVELHFGSPGDKRSIKKAKALKDVVDALYEYLNKESE